MELTWHYTDPFICECGTHTTMGNRTKHKRTKKHLAFINEAPITETCICGSIIMTQSKRFHILSNEHLRYLHFYASIICECGAEINRNSKRDHIKSNKHIKYLALEMICECDEITTCGNKTEHYKSDRHIAYISCKCECGQIILKDKQHEHQASKEHRHNMHIIYISNKPFKTQLRLFNI